MATPTRHHFDMLQRMLDSIPSGNSIHIQGTKSFGDALRQALTALRSSKAEWYEVKLCTRLMPPEKWWDGPAGGTVKFEYFLQRQDAKIRGNTAMDYRPTGEIPDISEDAIAEQCRKHNEQLLKDGWWWEQNPDNPNEKILRPPPGYVRPKPRMGTNATLEMLGYGRRPKWMDEPSDEPGENR